MKKCIVILLTAVLIFATSCSPRTTEGKVIFPTSASSPRSAAPAQSGVIRTSVRAACAPTSPVQTNALSALSMLGVQLDGGKRYSAAEGVAIAIKLMGKEQEALAANYPHPFEGVADDLSPYVGYAYAMRLIDGGGLDGMGGDIAACILRGGGVSGGDETRGDELALLLWNALNEPLPTGETPARQLIAEGAFSKESYSAAQAAFYGSTPTVQSEDDEDDEEEDERRERSRDDEEGIIVIDGSQYQPEIITPPTHTGSSGGHHSSGGSSGSGSSGNSGSNTSGSGGATDNTGNSGGTNTGGSDTGAAEVPPTGGAGGIHETPTIPFE